MRAGSRLQLSPTYTTSPVLMYHLVQFVAVLLTRERLKRLESGIEVYGLVAARIACHFIENIYNDVGIEVALRVEGTG